MLAKFVPNSSATVLVVGDVILDRYIFGSTTRISPEAPVPVVRVERTEERPGGAANVALNIRSLGVGVQLTGITGEDAAAELLARELSAAEVNCRFIRQNRFPTVTKLRVISQHQQLLRLDYEEEPIVVDTEGLYAQYLSWLSSADCVVLSDYAKGSLVRVAEFISAARHRSVPVLVDPKGREFSRYRGATVLTPNLREFEEVVGTCPAQKEIVAKGEELCRTLGLSALLVTQGEQGMTVIDADRGNTRHLPAQAQEVYDVTGAGDTVIAALAAALVSGYPVAQAAEFANIAAGLVVAKLGTATVSPEELNVVSARGPATRRGVLGRQELLDVTTAARTRGERIVMTNGCFDLLHSGHVEYLERARALGDRLVVAVNDDASVSRLKGRGRPINCVRERMRLVAALRSVDWVTEFSEDTPEALVESVSPDILVKGGDYRPDQIAGAGIVRARGGQVVVLPLVEGSSTSTLIEAIETRLKNAAT